MTEQANYDIDFDSDIDIDINGLDREWEIHSSKYLKCSQDYANAVFAKDQAKLTLEAVKADLDADIRQNPEKFGVDKVTEAVVANTVILQQDYQDAYTAYTETIRDVNMILAAKSAFEHKKKALEKLTDLYISGYWSEPRVTSEAKDAIDRDRRSSATDSLNTNQRMSRRKQHAK
jgi:hypothetical protein